MKLHREGHKIIIRNIIVYAILTIAAYTLIPWWWLSALAITTFTVFLGISIRFFRVPHRIPSPENGSAIYAPADGTIVAIEEVFESEYLQTQCILVSVFMSLGNVHINWFPVGGQIKYFKHHNGSFRVAWHPKSSEQNERTTTVIDTGTHRVLFRQIAGYVARRIVSYADGNIDTTIAQNHECGFIKFGSRVDLLLPLDSDIHVKLDDKVIGTQTTIATLPN